MKGSKYLVRIDFTPLGYAHLRHLGDLKQSWQNWWRLYGDICSCCQDSKNQVLYRTHVIKGYWGTCRAVLFCVGSWELSKPGCGHWLIGPGQYCPWQGLR